MATYVVIQDIEAEDKLLGPLSLRQFLYAVITVVLGFVMFQLFAVSPLLSIPFLPVTLLFAMLAAPLGRDQPSEVWLLAKIRFILKPRRRIWDQSGLQELVTITVPKKIERQLTDGLSENEVQSRLKALANTIDTRGWAVKGMNTNIAANPAYYSNNSQRLFDMNALMPAVNPDAQVPLENDPLASYSPVAQQFTQMVAASDQAHRQQIMDKMDRIRVEQFTQDNLPAPVQAAPVQPVSPVAQQPAPPVQNPAPQAPISQVIPQPIAPLPQPLVTSQQVAYGNTHILQPLQPQATPATTTDNPVTAPGQAAKMELAQNNDLNVATIARQANKNDGPQDEVVISLR